MLVLGSEPNCKFIHVVSGLFLCAYIPFAGDVVLELFIYTYCAVAVESARVILVSVINR